MLIKSFPLFRLPDSISPFPLITHPNKALVQSSRIQGEFVSLHAYPSIQLLTPQLLAQVSHRLAQVS